MNFYNCCCITLDLISLSLSCRPPPPRLSSPLQTAMRHQRLLFPLSAQPNRTPACPANQLPGLRCSNGGRRPLTCSEIEREPILAAVVSVELHFARFKRPCAVFVWDVGVGRRKTADRRVGFQRNQRDRCPMEIDAEWALQIEVTDAARGGECALLRLSRWRFHSLDVVTNGECKPLHGDPL